MTARRPRVDGFVDAWTHAELRGDVTLLAQLLHDDFVAVDEGRTVDKETWISRYRSGGLVHHAFFWRTLDARASTVSVPSSSDASTTRAVTAVEPRAAGAPSP